MKKNIFNTLLFSSVLFLACNTDTANKAPDSMQVAKDSNNEKFDTGIIQTDTKFAVAAADGGMLEIKTSQLALSKSANAKVKMLAEMMVEDHTKAAAVLKNIAATKNITLPSSLSNDSEKKYEKLAGKIGKDFDKSYATQMVADHKEVIDAFKKEIDNGKDADLKSFATTTLPRLQNHLKMSDSAKAIFK